MAFYKMQINTHNKTMHHILKTKVDLILPKFPEGWKIKRGMFSAIISGFVGFTFEGISSFFHNRRYKALHTAVNAMSIKTDIQRNKLMHLENTLLIYGVYNAETLERLVKQYTHYIADKHYMKTYSQVRHQLHMNTIHKCMANEAYSIMQLPQCYI